MVDHLLLAAIALTLIVALVGAGIFGRRVAPGPTLRKQTVSVQTVDDQTIRGVLVAEYADRIELEQAVFYASASKRTAVGGRVVVPRVNVSWLQVISASPSDDPAVSTVEA